MRRGIFVLVRIASSEVGIGGSQLIIGEKGFLMRSNPPDRSQRVGFGGRGDVSGSAVCGKGTGGRWRARCGSSAPFLVLAELSFVGGSSIKPLRDGGETNQVSRGARPGTGRAKGRVADCLTKRCAVAVAVGAVDQTDARLRGLSSGVARDRQCRRDIIYKYMYGADGAVSTRGLYIDAAWDASRQQRQAQPVPL